MTNTKNSCEERKCMDTGLSAFERNNYFCGKLMVERDFWAEQLYHVGKQRLHNSYLHGWGAVCGLRVDPHPHCPNLRVVVRRGLAIDCHGREILVPEDHEVELESYRKDGNGEHSKPESLFICLTYRECRTEPVPAFLDDRGCTETCEHNRIRETFEVKVLTRNDFGEDELSGYQYDRVQSTDKVDIDPSTALNAFDGKIRIRTLNGDFEAALSDYASEDVGKLLDDINNSAAGVKIEHIPDRERFVVTSENRWDIIILEETGTKPFFSAIKMPAFNTDKGNKIIESCPDRLDRHMIILAEIINYKDVTGSYLDPSHPDFKKPAYEVDNFSYRKTLPSMEIVSRLACYLMLKA